MTMRQTTPRRQAFRPSAKSHLSTAQPRPLATRNCPRWPPASNPGLPFHLPQSRIDGHERHDPLGNWTPRNGCRPRCAQRGYEEGCFRGGTRPRTGHWMAAGQTAKIVGRIGHLLPMVALPAVTSPPKSRNETKLYLLCILISRHTRRFRAIPAPFCQRLRRDGRGARRVGGQARFRPAQAGYSLEAPSAPA